MRSLGWALIQYDWCPYKENAMWRCRQREKATWWWRQRMEWCTCKPRNAKGCQEPSEAGRKIWNRSSPRVFERTWLCWHLDLAFWPPEPWEHQYLLLKSPSLLFFVMATPEKEQKKSWLMTQEEKQLGTSGNISSHSLWERASRWGISSTVFVHHDFGAWSGCSHLKPARDKLRTNVNMQGPGRAERTGPWWCHRVDKLSWSHWISYCVR